MPYAIASAIAASASASTTRSCRASTAVTVAIYASAVRRGRVAAVLAAALYTVVVLVAWSSIEDVNDYAGFVAGGRAILPGESPYDPATRPTAWEPFGTQRPHTSVYGYPPPG